MFDLAETLDFDRSACVTDLCACFIFLDVLIVDAKNDLNVYFTAKEPGGCGGGDSKANVPCCGTSATISEKSKAAEDLKNVDFNEWAGMFGLFFFFSAGANG